jgi:hypothetical protein
MKRRKTKKVKMVRILGETVRKGGVRYRYLLAERRHFLRRQRDPESSYYGVPISELLKSNRRRTKRCWEGYSPVKGMRPYSKGSCRKVRRNPVSGPAMRILGYRDGKQFLTDDKNVYTRVTHTSKGKIYDLGNISWYSTIAGFPASIRAYGALTTRGLRRNAMNRIPTQQEYEMRELAMFRKQMEEVERLPLAERKENAREWFNDLMNDQKLIAERVGWLLNGSYGKGSFDSACRVLASPRMNQVAWCAITIANLEWRCPAKMAIASWKKLPVETRYIVNEAIRREIADAKAEGYCG